MARRIDLAGSQHASVRDSRSLVELAWLALRFRAGSWTFLAFFSKHDDAVIRVYALLATDRNTRAQGRFEGAVTLFFSIAALFLSIAVVVIAALQWRVADNKLRLDLFDRRYQVYDATREFLDAVIGPETTSTGSELNEFNIRTSDAEFLFKADVAEYLAEIRRRAVHLRTARQLLKKPQISEAELSRHALAEHEDLSWLVDQTTAITQTFAPYLGFANVRLRFWPSIKLFSANR